MLKKCKHAALIGALAMVGLLMVAVPTAGAWTIGIAVQTKLTRTWEWGIQKTASPSTVTLEPGQTATVNYSVTVNTTGSTDSNWQAYGFANTYADPDNQLTVTKMDADVRADGSSVPLMSTSLNGCVPALPFVLVAPNYTSCPYSFSLPDGTSGRRVYLTETTLERPPLVESQAIDFSTADVNPVDDCVNVSDSVAGALGSACAGAAPKTFTYQRTVGPYSMSQCGDTTVPNTAGFTTNTTGATGNSSANVLVHVVCKQNTGALTRGFWGNKNGQGIISSGYSTSGVCNSATWLRLYAPFQDLSYKATCAGVAAYAASVFDGANSSGSSMNPMLKAQMLATALDVYFSNPALGGNKINAPAPIGGLTVDLTNVCAVIDSGGSGTCPSKFVDARSAFGGSASLTIAQMLAVAASNSNNGGSTWYGNVKSTQELAKDAFDAINNGVAFLV
jgi:hypothetical protein